MTNDIKNILKWQGGKSSLLRGPLGDYLHYSLFCENKDMTFIDAFAGGGSVFLYVLQYCPGVSKLVINDFNPALIGLYKDIKYNCEKLIDGVRKMQEESDRHSGTIEDQRKFYEKSRSDYNSATGIEKSILLLYINKACFNGIYRENSKGEFNVPMCDKSKIDIYDEDELRNISKLLNKDGVEIIFTSGDFEDVEKYIDDGNTFVYLDPPYRPLSGSPSFTSYTKESFNDLSQERLRGLCDRISNHYMSWFMVSNSYDPNDDYLIKLYDGYSNYQIEAQRSSGSKVSARGKVLENVFINYGITLPIALFDF